MALSTRRKRARREVLGLTRAEFAILGRLDAPERIQLFLNAIPANHEIGGETILSVREVLRQRRAHCIEGAFVAACALWIHGESPLLMFMDCDTSDHPHVLALFRRGRHWGAISKHNGAQLRYRDPVYRSLRELRKTLRSYSGAFDMRRIDPALWVTCDKACQQANDRLTALRRHPLISNRQKRLLARRDAFERDVAKIVEYPKPVAARV